MTSARLLALLSLKAAAEARANGDSKTADRKRADALAMLGD